MRDLPAQAPTKPAGEAGAAGSRRPGPPAPPRGPVIDVPIAIPSIEAHLPEPGVRAGSASREPAYRGPLLPGASGGSPQGSHDAYTREQVERIAALRAGAQPRYPRTLRAAGVEGAVVVRFVVDTTGRIEPGSIVVTRSSHDDFTTAVLDVLPKLVFAPATADGRQVRQYVELPFTFRVDR